MAKIQDRDWRYRYFKLYVDYIFKSSYRRVAFYGKEKIPRDGSVIFAPNHTNTLMDALAVLAFDKTPKVFATRADVFKHPTILKFFTFLKMLPINRKRDGLSNLAKNEEINNIAVEVLHDKTPFCILPEGSHRAMNSLMVLQKGIFRIALQANDTFGHVMPVYIVPVGITFGHFFRYRSSILVQTGEPINVTQFISQHPELTAPQQQIRVLREELSERMKKIILHIPDDANYNATLELSQLFGNEQRQRLGLTGNSLNNRFIAAKETILNIVALMQINPQDTLELLDCAGEFSRLRHTIGIGMKSILQSRLLLSLVGKIMLLILGFPYFIFSSIVTSPITVLFVRISLKIEDRAFYNSLRFLIALALLPVLLLLLSAPVAIIFSWVWGLVFALLFVPSYFFFYDYLHLTRSIQSDIKWLKNKDLQNKFKKIKHKFNLLLK